MSAAPELISKREFARREGCDESLVRRGIKEGRLVADQAGKLNAAHVGTGWRKRNLTADASSPGAEKGADKVSAQPDENLEEAAARISRTGEVPAYAVSLARKEYFLAILRELEVREKKGQLVDIDLAKAVLFEEFRAQRDAWLNWPVRIGPEIAADLGVPADRLTDLLTAHVHKQISALGEPDGEFVAA